MVFEMLCTPSASLALLYSLLVYFICKAHSRAPKRYPEWMHYWETVGEQLLIEAGDKESRAVWNLKKETGESHGAYRPGRSPAAKDGPDHLHNVLGFSSIYWHSRHWEHAVKECVGRKKKVCLGQRKLILQHLMDGKNKIHINTRLIPNHDSMILAFTRKRRKWID